MKIQNILIWFLYICFLFLILEGVFRFLGIPYERDFVKKGDTSYAQYDSELGWAYIPNHEIEVDFGEREDVLLSFDENSIRIPKLGFKFDPEKPTVIFTGASFTFGQGLFYDETFVAQLQKMQGDKYQFVNLGVQGYGTDQAYLRLKRHFEKFNVKVVCYLYMEAHDDRRNCNYDRSLLYPTVNFLGTKPLFGLKRNGELYLERKPMLYEDYIQSYLIDFMRIRLKLNMRESLPLTRALIHAMKRYSEERGARFVVFDVSNRISRVVPSDVQTITLSTLPEDWWEMRIPGDGHPDAEANKYIALSFSNYLDQ